MSCISHGSEQKQEGNRKEDGQRNETLYEAGY